MEDLRAADSEGARQPRSQARPEEFDAATRAVLAHIDGQAVQVVAEGRPANTRRGYAQDWTSSTKFSIPCGAEKARPVTPELGKVAGRAQRHVATPGWPACPPRRAGAMQSPAVLRAHGPAPLVPDRGERPADRADTPAAPRVPRVGLDEGSRSLCPLRIRYRRSR